MTSLANYRSIFSNSNTDDSKGLYEATKLVATNGGSGNNVPFYFLNFVADDNATTTATIIQQPANIDQIDADNNGIITSAVDNYIKHLGSGEYNNIPTSSETYRNTINPLINLIDQGTDPLVQYILDATQAAATVRQMFDDSFRLNSELAAEKVKYSELQQGLNVDMVFACESEENTGGLELHLNVELTPMLLKYIEIYGVPLAGQAVDSVKLTQIKNDMIAQGIDPYGRDTDSDNSEPDDFNKEGPLIEEIEALYEQYRTVAMTDTANRERIYRKIDSISAEAAKYAIANEYDKMALGIGAKGTNAYTSFEKTVYINDIPSNQLENWLKLESERFRYPVFRLFHTELEAVYEEKNRDSDGSKLFESLFDGLFPNHQYGQQTTIGTVEHLKNPSLIEIRAYFNKYYVPNNMAICLSGDFDYDETIRLIQKYWS